MPGRRARSARDQAFGHESGTIQTVAAKAPGTAGNRCRAALWRPSALTHLDYVPPVAVTPVDATACVAEARAARSRAPPAGSMHR